MRLLLFKIHCLLLSKIQCASYYLKYSQGRLESGKVTVEEGYDQGRLRSRKVTIKEGYSQNALRRSHLKCITPLSFKIHYAALF